MQARKSSMEITEAKGSDELLRAQTLLWSHIFNHIDSMALKCAVELGIPDAINSHGRAITLPQLLSALHISPTKAPQMRRVMRMLTHSGIFTCSCSQNNKEEEEEEEEEAYSLTPLSDLLVNKNRESSLSGFLLAMLHPVVLDPFRSMSAWFHGNVEASPFSLEHGCGLWEKTDRDPKFSKVFHEGMASDAQFLMNLLLTECGHVFQGLTSLVDVGGGTGSAAMAIAGAFPKVKCMVLDLPHVVDAMHDKGGNVDFIAGDMFDNVPQADAVFLKKWHAEVLFRVYFGERIVLYAFGNAEVQI